MDDLISRQALLKQIDIDSDGEPGYYGDTWKFIDTIKNMPPALGTNLAEVGTAEPQIVRCGNCEFWSKFDSSVQGKCLLLGIYPASGWYCANGRMRGKQNG